ncbi:hypothetical protein A2631_01245 [Candidatus Daviesbacteria bacterium RIFCSPHIGHO2_01_FULL_44_29]|uniref:ASCH domain-containing protein n=1 Tax=Candidatus Daviesbacteria bacterium RIFCSPHIGHO2_02_FULL_43_12 TaxID=1797776 RepID=A0A1F5KIC7_9BACT|nr:MAG: hypothetical protein A2631_01245 [Candidatus Daviesbacteria bacterium RIFCSPHIGHO2_01_FULL_44_29]OGE40361.1 MAG: hypothetical protein A3E86_01100 [Candidatus Daviesbacteria bacterium RIFCSPHIGHO2_12_FULL_47_45]OGE40703.1 MAG: hypothetical protein A3D25_05500 [Candidatus Daviesbacteria bacterium RIFCSPHIGHO2_02_FULL_43_12]OGE69800.1 MAG: hypothetical protein A3B55_05310 [Candidatus Daviesbacteria bacterium RIFCSPLOWO2_01_FULL_43_15]
MRRHLAIFTPQAVKEIFAGRKTIETRFSNKRLVPFGQVSKGDVVFIKPSGQEISGQFIVKKVLFFEGLDQTDFEIIKKAYGKDLSFGSMEQDVSYFKNKESAQFGTVIFIDRVERFITSPLKVPKSNRRGWVVLPLSN